MDSVNFDLKRFAHSVGQNWYHVVLVLKGEISCISVEGNKGYCRKAFDSICEKHNIDLFAREIMPDHVHLFVSCPPDCSIRKLFQILKGGSSFYIRKAYPSLRKYPHLWNRGTMYRSIGSVSSETVQHYIEESNKWSATKQKTLP